MAASLSPVRRLTGLLTQHMGWLASPENTLVAAHTTLTTHGPKGGVLPEPDVLYPHTALTHTVLASVRPAGRHVPKAARTLALVSYVSDVRPDSGRVFLGRPVRTFHLNEGLNTDDDSGRKPHLLPVSQGWLVHAASLLVEMVLSAREGRHPIDRRLRPCQFWVSKHPDPRRLLTEAADLKRLAVEFASGYWNSTLPGVLSPVDGKVLAVEADDAAEPTPTGGPRLGVLIQPTDQDAEPVLVLLPRTAVLDPSIRPGTAVTAGTELGAAVPIRRYRGWDDLVKTLTNGRAEDLSVIDWYLRQVAEVVEHPFRGYVPADWQDPISNCARPVMTSVPMDTLAVVADCRYNHTAVKYSTTAVDVDLMPTVTLGKGENAGRHSR